MDAAKSAVGMGDGNGAGMIGGLLASAGLGSSLTSILGKFDTAMITDLLAKIGLNPQDLMSKLGGLTGEKQDEVAGLLQDVANPDTETNVDSIKDKIIGILG